MVNNGLVHELQHSADLFDGQYTATSVTVTISAALAVYNALELILLILTTFRCFNGLYFWSLCAATYGILMYTTGFMIEYFQFTAQLTGLTIRVLGWPAMVTGQSFVLYSRLSMVLGPGYDNWLRALKWIIIFDAIVHHGGTIILTFGAYYASPSATWIHAYNVQHKVQRTCFCIQEGVLSLIYIWRALTILRQTSSLRDRKQTWLLMWQLIAINVIIEALDVFILVEEYAALHATKQAVKAMIYSIKLKLEFAVLGRLVEVTSHRGNNVQLNLQGSAEAATSKGQKSRSPHAPTLISKLNAFLCVRPRSVSSYDIEECDTASAVTVVEQEAVPVRPIQHTADMAPAITNEDKWRRRHLEEDLYAGACRDLVG